MYLGANGIVFRDRVTVNVTWTPRLVTVPVNPDDSAGTPVVLVTSPRFFAKGIPFVDGLALDVHGNLWLAAPAMGLARVSRDGTDIQAVVAVGQQGLTAPPLSLAFGTGGGERESLFLTTNSSFGGTGSGLVRVRVGVPGLPLP